MHTKSNYSKSIALMSFLIIMSFVTYAQDITLASGIGTTSFIDFKKNVDHSYAYYKRGSNQFLKIEFNSVLPELRFMDIGVKLERSTGTIEANEFNFLWCGLGPHPSSSLPDINAEFEIYRIALDVLPFKFNIYKHISFNGGVEVSKLLRVNSKNLDLRDSSGFAPDNQEDEEPYRNFGFGILCEVQLWKFNLSSGYTICPRYSASMSWLDEIKTDFSTRTVRQSLGLAISWQSH